MSTKPGAGHSQPFEQHQLWRYAADFRTLTGKQLGIKLTRRAEGVGELDVYFDSKVSTEEKIIFSRYVNEHLRQTAQDVERLRHYVCPHCAIPIGNREVAMRRLSAWLEERPKHSNNYDLDRPTILCSNCEKRVPLWDEIEQWFAQNDVQQRVYALQRKSVLVLDSESRERALVGDVISAVVLAGQICRETGARDNGIDMEVEFKSDEGQPTQQKIYMHLEPEYARLVQREKKHEILLVDHRYVNYWRKQSCPVFLVIRDSLGEIQWMNVSDYLQRTAEIDDKSEGKIVFSGERFDVMSVRNVRDAALAGARNKL